MHADNDPAFLQHELDEARRAFERLEQLRREIKEEKAEHVDYAVQELEDAYKAQLLILGGTYQELKILQVGGGNADITRAIETVESYFRSLNEPIPSV